MTYKELLDLHYKNLSEQKMLLIRNKYTVAHIKTEIANLKRNIKHLKKEMNKHGHTK